MGEGDGGEMKLHWVISSFVVTARLLLIFLNVL